MVEPRLPNWRAGLLKIVYIIILSQTAKKIQLGGGHEKKLKFIESCRICIFVLTLWA